MIEKPAPCMEAIRAIRAMQEHIAEFTGVNEDFEIIFNAAGVENMNRAKVSKWNIAAPFHNKPAKFSTSKTLLVKQKGIFSSKLRPVFLHYSPAN